MVHENQFRVMLRQEKPTVCTRLLSTWPYVVEVAGSTGKYDYVEFTAEYAPYDQYDLENVVRAAEVHGMASMMKVDYQNRGYAAQKAIASGFQAILFTDHTAPEEVEETIKLILPKCPAYNGEMGYANRRWIGYQAASTQEEYANMVADTVRAFMIEKKEAVDRIDEICAVQGIDLIQFGPNDFALSSGFNWKDEKKRVQDAEKKVIETAIRYGIRPRCEINSAEDAKYYLDLGVKDFSLGLELRILQNFLNKEGDALLNLMAQKGLVK